MRDHTGARWLFPRHGEVMVCDPPAADALFALWSGAADAARPDGAVRGHH